MSGGERGDSLAEMARAMALRSADLRRRLAQLKEARKVRPRVPTFMRTRDAADLRERQRAQARRAPAARRVAPLPRRQVRLLARLAEAPGGMTLPSLALALGRGERVVQDDVNELIRRGRVEQGQTTPPTYRVTAATGGRP